MSECREKIGELLSQVCSGVGTEEVPAALQGLLAAAAHVRAAAIVALLDVPVFAEGARRSCNFCTYEIKCGTCIAAASGSIRSISVDSHKGA